MPAADPPRTSDQSQNSAQSTISLPGDRDRSAPPRLQTSQPPGPADVMEIDTDEPEQAPPSPRGRKRTLAESEVQSLGAEVSTEPQFKRSRTKPPDTEQPLAPVSDGRRPWHQDVVVSDDIKGRKQIDNLLSAIRSNASPVTINKMLFGENSLWLDQTFKIMTLRAATPDQCDLLAACGGYVLSDCHPVTLNKRWGEDLCTVIMTANDFDHAQLAHELKYRQSTASRNSSKAGTTECSLEHPATSLMLAAEWGDLALVEELIANGARVNDAEYKNNETPLILATYAGHSAITQKLIQAGADIDAQNGKELRAPEIAAGKGSEEICRLFLDHEGGIEEYVAGSALTEAAAGGHTSICQLLLDRFPDMLSDEDDSGTVALREAAIAGHEDVCRWLIDKGVSTHDLAGTEAENLLSLAAESGNVSLFKFLVAQGLPIDDENSDYTPLMSAALVGHLELVKFILSQGVKIDRRNKWGRTALFFACGAGSVQLVETLLKHGASLHLADNDSDDALAWATASQNISVVNYLLTHHVHLWRNSDRGNQALWIALDQLSVCLSKNRSAKTQADVLMLLMDHIQPEAYKIQHWPSLQSKFPAPVISKPIVLEIIAICVAIKWPAIRSIQISEPNPAFLMKEIVRALDIEPPPLAINSDRLAAEKMICIDGVPAILLDSLGEQFETAQRLQPALSGSNSFSPPAIRNMCSAGMLANLERELLRMEQGWDPFSEFELNEELQRAMTASTRDRLRVLVDHGLAYESERLAPVFANLPDICLTLSLEASHAMEWNELVPATSAGMPATHTVAEGLCNQGVYAPLAHTIGTAWASACMRVPKASFERWKQAAGYLPAALNVAVQAWLGSPIDDTAQWIDEGFDEQRTSFATTSATMPPPSHLEQASAEDAAVKAQLQSDFRQALRDRLAISHEYSLLRHPDLSEEANSLYADLMFRQLHMLSQFIAAETSAQ